MSQVPCFGGLQRITASLESVFGRFWSELRRSSNFLFELMRFFNEFVVAQLSVLGVVDW